MNDAKRLDIQEMLSTLLFICTGTCIGDPWKERKDLQLPKNVERNKDDTTKMECAKGYKKTNADLPLEYVCRTVSEVLQWAPCGTCNSMRQ